MAAERKRQIRAGTGSRWHARASLHFSAIFCSQFTQKRRPAPCECNPRWRNPNHFANCSNFEQSLLKMVTRREKWSTSAGSGWPRGPSLVVQVSGGALARTSSVAPSINIKSNFRGYKRVDTIFRAGLLALLFFYFELGFPPCSSFDENVSHSVGSRRSGRDGANQSDPAQL